MPHRWIILVNYCKKKKEEEEEGKKEGGWYHSFKTRTGPAGRPRTRPTRVNPAETRQNY
jgi:hypothetical protein